MSDIATIEPVTPAPRRIPKRIQQAVRLLASGECKSIKAASERVGMNYTYLCEQFRKPQIQAFATRESVGNITRGTLRASARYVELIDASSEHVSAKVSERILEQGGILKPQSGGVNVSISNNIAAGYVIDLSPRKASPDQGQVIDAISPDASQRGLTGEHD